MDKEKVLQYLIQEKNNTDENAEKMFLKISKYHDIYSEFLQWLDHRNYSFTQPVTSGDYSAQAIFELAPFLDGIGVYNFLITLRDDPELAQKIIANKFRVE